MTNYIKITKIDMLDKKEREAFYHINDYVRDLSNGEGRDEQPAE